MSNKEKTLGIMTYCNGPTFMEKAYYKKLTLFGHRWGIRVFVFSPQAVDFRTRQVTGYEYRQGEWKKGTFPLPDTVYDRCFVGPSYRHYKPFIEKLQKDPAITFLGHGLSGKWQVHRILSQSPALKRWLPETHPFKLGALFSLLESKGAAVIKPAAGTHGIGVVRISRENGKYAACGRGQENKPFQRFFRTRAGLKTFVTHFVGGRSFLLQPYLTLHTPDGVPYDVRVLVQKNGFGQWQTTGKAVRVGDRKSITSNLHGGGRAAPLSDFLAGIFPEEQRIQIDNEIDQLVRLLPPILEEHHGRLVELGIDIGIDTNGHVWLIEVNSRPGRTVFRQLADRTARLRSLTQPVRYAHYLMKERVGGY